MSAEQNKVHLRQSIETIFNAGNLNTIDEFIAADLAEAFRRDVASLRAAFPDLRLIIDELIAEGEKVAVRFELRGTHRGVLSGVPPTGRPMAWKGMGVVRFVDGKIAEWQF